MSIDQTDRDGVPSPLDHDGAAMPMAGKIDHGLAGYLKACINECHTTEKAA